MPDPTRSTSEKPSEAEGTGRLSDGPLEQATPAPWNTWTLVGLNALVFCLMALAGVSALDPSVDALRDWGADYGPFTFEGEWWRLITNAFVHVGIVHLAVNMWCLWSAGAVAERWWGRWKFVSLYGFAALTASLLSIALQPEIVSPGAFGAIFGVYGALVTGLYLRKRSAATSSFSAVGKEVVVFVVYNVLYGLGEPGIDNIAHLGGLLGGALFALLFRPYLGEASERWPQVRFAYVRVLVLLAPTVALFWAGLRATVPARSALNLEICEAYLADGAYEEALSRCERALEIDPDNQARRAHALENRALCRGAIGKTREALADYTKSIELYKDLVEKKSRVDLGTDLAGALDRRAWAHYRANVLPAAMSDFAAGIEICTNLLKAGSDPRSLEQLGDLHYNRAKVLKDDDATLGEASDDYQRAAEIYSRLVKEEDRTDFSDYLGEALLDCGVVFARQERWPEALTDYEAAIVIFTQLVKDGGLEYVDDFARTHDRRGHALERLPEAIEAFESAVGVLEEAQKADNGDEAELAEKIACRGDGYFAGRRFKEALADYSRSVELYTSLVEDDEISWLARTLARVLNKLARFIATCPDAEFQDGTSAGKYAERACELSGWENSDYLDTLATSKALAGDFAEAVKWQSKALELATEDSKEKFAQRLALFKNGKPYRETEPGITPPEGRLGITPP